MRTFLRLILTILLLVDSLESSILEKKYLASELIQKAPRSGADLDIQKRLEALRKGNNKFDNNNNNRLPLPPPSPPTFNNFITPSPPPAPPSFNLFQTNIQVPPPPLTSPPLLPLPRQTLRARPTATQSQPATHFGEMTMTKTKPEKEQKLDDISTAICEVIEAPKIEIGDPLFNFLSTDAEGILADDYVNPEVLENRTIEQIKEEYKFDDIKDAFGEGKIPPQLDFFFFWWRL